MKSLRRGDHVILPDGRKSTIKGMRTDNGVPMALCGTPSWRGSFRPHGVYRVAELKKLVPKPRSQ